MKKRFVKHICTRDFKEEFYELSIEDCINRYAEENNLMEQKDETLKEKLGIEKPVKCGKIISGKFKIKFFAKCGR